MQLGERRRETKEVGHRSKALGSLKNSHFIKQKAQGNSAATSKRNCMWKELCFSAW